MNCIARLTAWASALVDSDELCDRRWRLRQIEGIKPFESDDPDSERIFWQEGGVHQNLAFPVHPEPVSGMHCWHQRMRVEPSHSADNYRDMVVDTKLSHVDLHISKVLYKPEEHKPFEDIVKSVMFAPKSK